MKNLQIKKREALDAAQHIQDVATAEKREMTAEESVQFNSHMREASLIQAQMEAAIAEEQHKNIVRELPKDMNKELREQLKEARNHQRELTFTTEVANAGAANLTINDVIKPLHKDSVVPASLAVATGVTGNEIWPKGITAAKIEEVGENTVLTDQKVDFDKVQANPKRTGITIEISNTAIDNAAIDLVGYVNEQMAEAVKDYVAEKLYSQAAFTGNKGPFSGKTSAGTITLGNGSAYKNILKGVAKMAAKGYNKASLCLVIDAETEADLMAEPKASGQGGFVIENGKLAGYNYVVSEYLNTKLNTAGTALEATTDKYLGIGFWAYEALQSHGVVRTTADGQSAAVARKNVTAITMNGAWSFTTLDANAFAIYKLA